MEWHLPHCIHTNIKMHYVWGFENNCQSLNILILFGMKFIHNAKNCNVQLSTIQFIEFLKTKLYKIDPDTEKILQFIKALCPEFDIAAK